MRRICVDRGDQLANRIHWNRPGWDTYFLAIAEVIALRADCSRARHGAVIAKANRIVATGYNGAPVGQDGCRSKGACPRASSNVVSLSGYDNCIAVHAEANALLYADRDKCEGATLYVTGEPCQWCARLAEGAGIARLIWLGERPDDFPGPVA